MNSTDTPAASRHRDTVDVPRDTAMHLTRLLPEGTGSDSLRRVYARILWSLLAEPGDRHAGALVAALGPECVGAMIGRRRAELLADFSAATGSAPGREWGAAFERWESRRGDVVALAQRVCAAGTRIGAGVLVPGMTNWPRALDDLGPHAPLVIWVRGEMDAVVRSTASLAVVGARASSAYGDTVAGEIAAHAVDEGITIVSGGAYGIDAMAHRGALTSRGCTVAVVAGGVDRFYPAGNRVLFERIERDGAIISELAPGSSPTRWRFLQRNRVIAALARATIVVEAGARSGALNTAHHALELGRHLGAVPGSVLSSSSVGTHRLIADGLATLISGPDAAIELFREGMTEWDRSSQSRGISDGVEEAGDEGLNPRAVVSGTGSVAEPREATGRDRATGADSERGAGRATGTDSERGAARATGTDPEHGAGRATGAYPEHGEHRATEVRRATATARAGSDAVRGWDALLVRRGRDVDEIARRSGLSTRETRSALAELELSGHAERGDDGLWRRRSGRGRPDR